MDAAAARRALQVRDGFQQYRVTTTATPEVFVVFCAVFVCVLIAVAAPFACWAKNRSELAIRATQQQDPNNNNKQQQGEDGHILDYTQDGVTVDEEGSSAAAHSQDEVVGPGRRGGENDKPIRTVWDVAVFHREHLEAMKQIQKEYNHNKKQMNNSNGNSTRKHHSRHHQQQSQEQSLRASYPTAGANSNHNSGNNLHCDERNSNVSSVATTSRLFYGGSGSKRRRQMMPWRNSRGIPRSASRLMVEQRHQSSLVSGMSNGSNYTHAQHPPHPKKRGKRRGRLVAPGAVSDAAGWMLDRQSTMDGEADSYRRQLSSTSVVRSLGGSDVGSVMPPLHPDVVSPDDAADANDPGRQANPIRYGEAQSASHASGSSQAHRTSTGSEKMASVILDVAEPDFEMRRVLALAIPSTVGSMADPFFRIVMVAIISHSIGTEAMVAYLLVLLFIRLTTEEVSGAIADAESNLIQDVLAQGGEVGCYQAGQVIQLAILIQLAIGVPVLVTWFFLMDDVILSLVGSPEIAEIASKYTGVIIIDYIIRGASRTFMVPFYLTGQAQFEANIDLVATILTLLAIAVVAATTDMSLTSIGWIQVIIAIAKTIIKVSYVVLKGWLQPYRIGFLNSWAAKVRNLIGSRKQR
jgi:hypothetical protein